MGVSFFYYIEVAKLHIIMEFCKSFVYFFLQEVFFYLSLQHKIAILVKSFQLKVKSLRYESR